MKAKLSIKKALSLIVVLVMLLTMIPVGMISVSAAPTIDLSDYDYATEYVIMNVEDWILIATEAQDKDFSGITVKLGADLDFSELTTPWDDEHVPAEGSFSYPMYDGQYPSSSNEVARLYMATVPTLFNEFAGYFDGQGYTISNARFEEGGIAKKTLDGAEVINVNFENVGVADFYDYMAYGIVAGEVKGSLWVENVHVTESNVYMNTVGTIHTGSGAALLGFVSAAAGNEGAFVGISNCSVDADVSCGNYKAWGYGYGTGMAVGTVDSNVDFEMTGCEFSGTLNSIDWFAGVVGAIYAGAEREIVISDIKIDGLTMDSNRGAVTNGVNAWGSLIGGLSLYDNASVTIDRITVTDTSITTLKGQAIGGLIGIIQPMNSPATIGGLGKTGGGTPYGETIEDTSIEISNIYVDAFLWCNGNTSGGVGVGGLIAQVGEGNNNGNANGRIMTGEINIYNVYLGGTYIDGFYNESAGTWTIEQGAGGLFKCISLAETEINLSNIIVDAVFPINEQYVEAPENLDELLEAFAAGDAAAKAELEAYSSRKKGKVRQCVGLIANAPTIRQGTTGDYIAGEDGFLEAYVNASNITTSLNGDFNLFCWLNRKGSIIYNGEDISRGDDSTYAPPVENTDGAILQVRPNEAKQMVQFDEDGFVINVASAINLATPQVAGDDVRFVALAYVDEVASATATVTFKAAGEVVKTFTFDSVSLLDGLTAVEGTEIAEYDAEDFFATKFMAVTIKGIPAGEYDVEWSFEYTTLGGAVIEAADATSLTIA